MSAAGDGSTEPHLNFSYPKRIRKMQIESHIFFSQ